MKRSIKITERISAYVVALILLQTLFYKFSGAEESKYIFSTLGMEPVGRIGSGIAELIAGILLIVPSTAVYGAIISLGVISGAILSHLFILGIEIRGDHGQLFLYACLVFIGSVLILFFRREEIKMLIASLFSKS